MQGKACVVERGAKGGLWLRSTAEPKKAAAASRFVVDLQLNRAHLGWRFASGPQCVRRFAGAVHVARIAFFLLLMSAHARAAMRIGELANPKNDAADIAAALKGIAFQVIEGFDLNKAAVDRKMRDFAAALS